MREQLFYLETLDDRNFGFSPNRYRFIRTAKSHVACIDSSYHRAGSIGELVICPGFPGKQNLENLEKHLADFGFNVHLPLHPGTAHRFDGDWNEIVSTTSFSDACTDIREYLRTEIIAKDKRMILGFYSLGTIFAAGLVQEFRDYLDGLVMISGVYDIPGFFAENVYTYRSLAGWAALEQFFCDCVTKQHLNGNTPLKGDPDQLYRDFKSMAEQVSHTSANQCFSDISTMVIHSLTDKWVPFAHARRFFPAHADVLIPEMDHSLMALQGQAGDPQREIAAAIAEMIRE